MFIWGSNWERVSRNKLCNNIEFVGAKMMHLESYLIALNAKSLSFLFDEIYCSQTNYSIEALNEPIGIGRKSKRATPF